MHELINLILASATASIHHAFNFFPTDEGRLIGASHSFYGYKRTINSTSAVRTMCKLMKISFNGTHFTHPLCHLWLY